MKPGRPFSWILGMIALCCALAGAAVVEASRLEGQTAQPEQVTTPSEEDATAEPEPGLGAKLKRALWIFFLLSIGALVLLIGTAVFLLRRAKQLVENAVKPDLPALERFVAKKRAKFSRRETNGTTSDLGPKDLSKKLIHRQAMRAGLVGFATGLGGLPALPIAIPIDLAATIKLQSNLVHMLRIANGGQVQAEDVSEASLWLITTGGQALAVASGTMIRELIVKTLSKSLLKFVPVIGGVVGFALNWASTQTLGRLTLRWLEGQGGPQAVGDRQTGVEGARQTGVEGARQTGVEGARQTTD